MDNRLFSSQITLSSYFYSYNELLQNTNSANILFLDQNGISQITEEVFSRLISYKMTDFLFFISSSTINRFYDDSNIKKYLDTSKIVLTDYYNVHRSVVNYYRTLIPKDETYYIAPFSLKKDKNIYGLIFGTHHLKGIYKFLKICWEMDPLRGEANYDIDKDNICEDKPSLFEKFNIPKKLIIFEEDIITKITNKELLTDKDVVIYSLENGFLPQHSKVFVNKLVENNIIKKKRYSLSESTLKIDYLPKAFEVL